MATRICKRFTFEAAHHLPLHDGKCKRVHGHSYIVEVFVVGELHTTGPKSGMVMDYGDLSQLWKLEFESVLDHRDLNNVLDTDHTTAECIAMWLFTRFRTFVGEDVERVRVWETSSSYAEHPA